MWIKCSERLPEKEGRYLVAFKVPMFSSDIVHNVISIETLWVGNFNGVMPYIITHWMELPEFPKDE